MDSWVDDVRDSTLPNLEVLDISGCRRLKKIDIESLFGMSKERCRVNVLRMGMSPGIQCDSLEWLIALGMDESLIHLSVEGNSTLSDTAVNDLVKFQALEELDLGNTCVSGIGVLKLVTRGSGNLKWLGLDLCDHISKETVDDVRKLGVAVSHKRSQQLKGGRKVRHGY